MARLNASMAAVVSFAAYRSVALAIVSMYWLIAVMLSGSYLSEFSASLPFFSAGLVGLGFGSPHAVIGARTAVGAPTASTRARTPRPPRRERANIRAA